jgi:hypothetical protein
MGQIPCPFARKALVDDQVDWRFIENADELEKLRQEMYFDKEIVVIGFDPESFTVLQIEDFIDRFNSDYMPKGIVAFEDHPHEKQTAAGVNMNQGKWGWIGIQRLDKLDRASEMLSRKGYYDNWTEEEFRYVVSWRYEEDRRFPSYRK